MPYTMPAKKRAVGGDSAAPASGGPAQSAAPAQSAPGYVDFSRILSANQQGAQSMADKLAGQVQQQGQQAQGAIKDATAKVSNATQAGTLQYERSSLPSSAPTDPNAYREAGRVAGQRAEQGYQGPKDWSGAGVDVAGLTSQAAKAEDAAKNLTTAGGRGAMLREQAGGPYSAGMSALDAALSGAALGNRGQDLSAMYGNLSQQLADAQTTSGSQTAAAQAASEDAATHYGQDALDWSEQGDALAARQQVIQQTQQGADQVNRLYGRLFAPPAYTQHHFLGLPLSKHPRKGP